MGPRRAYPRPPQLCGGLPAELLSRAGQTGPAAAVEVPVYRDALLDRLDAQDVDGAVEASDDQPRTDQTHVGDRDGYLLMDELKHEHGDI